MNWKMMLYGLIMYNIGYWVSYILFVICKIN